MKLKKVVRMVYMPGTGHCFRAELECGHWTILGRRLRRHRALESIKRARCTECEREKETA